MKKKTTFEINSIIIYLFLFLVSSLFTFSLADEIVGDVRVQILSSTIVRLELRGPQGFEDRETFHITERNWPGASVIRSSFGGYELIETSDFIVKIPSGAQSLDDIVITEINGEVLWSASSPTADVTIKCAWTGHYLFDNGNQLSYGFSPVDNSYFWTLESENGYTQIRNKATGDYINLENDFSYVECTPVQTDWHSKDWILENAGDYKRLRCRDAGSPDYIHIEYLQGYAEHAPAGTSNGNDIVENWFSAKWIIGTDLFSSNQYLLPNPNGNIKAWAIADTPRYIPASSSEPWGGGYSLAPFGTPNNGWDLSNDSQDIYVFLPKGDGRQLRSDYIALTGRTELIPLHALGGWDSRFYAYSQQEALDKIDTYRFMDIPLDVFVLDTDWRVGGSSGYDVDTALFPDMQQFLSDSHSKNVRVMFNDHPEPQGNALDYDEVEYRNNGLISLFDIGLDTWWYDRNWHTAIIPPSGINKEVFGMYIYHWITQSYYPDRRPMIMANFDGVDNGNINRLPNIAAHRYSIQWTGDIYSDYESLEQEVRNAVYLGLYVPFAYVSADLGGFTGSTPTVKQYCRWIQFGAMSPIFRLHCTKGQTRDPWDFADPAEEVVRDYVQMRMRLLPVFYNAARDNYDSGEPILKRCDLNYSGFIEAESNSQYLLGDNILVAPIVSDNDAPIAVPSNWLDDDSGSTGLAGRYYSNKYLSGSPIMTQVDSKVDFRWSYDSPGTGLPSDNFSVRWTGNITINAGYDVNLGISCDDGCRVWIDNVLVINKWFDQAETTYWAPNLYSNGQTYSVKIEYYENSGAAACRFLAVKPSSQEPTERQLWIPPGNWTDVWTGNMISGPQMHTASAGITEMPIFVKQGSIILLAPDMEYTSEKAWDPITLEVHPSINQIATANLYEDDGVSNQYKSGTYRNTVIEAYAHDATKEVFITIGSAQGTYAGALSDRSWILRLRMPEDFPEIPQNVTIDGNSMPFNIIPKDHSAMPFSVSGGSPDNDIIEIQIPSALVSLERSIVVQAGCTQLTGDINNDCVVDMLDFVILAEHWLENGR